MVQLRVLTAIQRQTAVWCDSISGLSVSKEAWELVMETKTGLHFPGCHFPGKKEPKLTFRDRGDSETKAQER